MQISELQHDMLATSSFTLNKALDDLFKWPRTILTHGMSRSKIMNMMIFVVSPLLRVKNKMLIKWGIVKYTDQYFVAIISMR